MNTPDILFQKSLQLWFTSKDCFTLKKYYLQTKESIYLFIFTQFKNKILSDVLIYFSILLINEHTKCIRDQKPAYILYFIEG